MRPALAPPRDLGARVAFWKLREMRAALRAGCGPAMVAAAYHVTEDVVVWAALGLPEQETPEVLS